jgi:quinol monooxygenase YgiN
METVTVVLNVKPEHVDAFEAGFREHELPVWRDLRQRGLVERATLSRLDISSRPVDGTVQYLVAVIFTSDEGHHVHDSHPGFQAWNAIADGYQAGDAMAFGGETVVDLAAE